MSVASLILVNLAASIVLITRIFYVILLVRVVASFFPPRRPGIWAQISAISGALTDPVLAPLRNRIPLWGGLDFSPLIALFLINIVGNLVASGLLWLATHV